MMPLAQSARLKSGLKAEEIFVCLFVSMIKARLLLVYRTSVGPSKADKSASKPPCPFVSYSCKALLGSTAPSSGVI